MKHLILGTAGHVDHGKTSLIRALTGFDCDTHKEEQSRGITIHLGFTNISIDQDHQVGVIDVPGHKDFVNTMISGASGIDFVMLVIAADSGIMPQTIEHMKIMQLLNIKSGFIALTKIDLVDEDLLELAIAEIQEFTEGTFLENSNIIKVSAKSGQGLEDIKAEIVNQIDNTDERDLGLIFRMYIDRIFTSEGHGTIINGSVLSGKIHKQDELTLLPLRKDLRIRGMQKFHKEVDELKAGDRASLNVVGLKKSDFKRGMLITNYPREMSLLLDCVLDNFSANKLKLWTTVIFLSGTFKSKAKVHLIDCDELKENSRAIVQITLDTGSFFYYNDKYILRDTSNNYTIGGGRIIDAFPLKHRKRPKGLIEDLQKLAESDMKYLLLHEIEKSIDIENSRDLSLKLNIPEERVRDLANSLANEVAIIQQNDLEIYIILSHLNKIHNEIIKIVRHNQINNCLSEKGLEVSDIAKYLLSTKEKLDKNSIKIILDNMVDSKKLKITQNTYCPINHNPQDFTDLLNKRQDIIQYINSFKKEIPEEVTKENIKIKYNLKNQEFNSIMNSLIEMKRVLFYDNLYVSIQELEEILSKMKEEFKDQAFRIADFRDMLGTNRKIALYYLEIFDKLGITQRKDDYRNITKKNLI